MTLLPWAWLLPLPGLLLTALGAGRRPGIASVPGPLLVGLAGLAWIFGPRQPLEVRLPNWLPFLPDSTWQSEAPRREGNTQVYLDVSGSMNAEMPQIIALLGRLSRYIRRPFWAFSTVVAPALIENGQLKTTTSGGTSMHCVLEHLADTKPDAAVVVTDGYVERLNPTLVKRTAATRVHVLLTRDGSAAELRRAGLPYTQLDKVPA